MINFFFTNHGSRIVTHGVTNMTDTWMWQPSGEEAHGLVLDQASSKLLWYIGLGCTCGEDMHPIEQTIAEYLISGVPGLVSQPPDDIKTELKMMIGLAT